MKSILILYFLTKLFLIKSLNLEFLNPNILSAFNAQGNKLFDNEKISRAIKNISDINPIPDDKEARKLIIEIIEFVIRHTNVTSNDSWTLDFFKCGRQVFDYNIKGFPNYLNVIAYSGKSVSDLGLQNECIRANFNYYLFTYEFIINSNYMEQNRALKFFQQHTFFTGLCFPKICKNSLNLIFNQTLDPALFEFIKENLNIISANIYDVGSMDRRNLKDPTRTYEKNGKYNEEKTKNEQKKFRIFVFFVVITSGILFIQFVVSILSSIFKLIYKGKQLAQEKDDNIKVNVNETEEESQSTQLIFNTNTEKKEEKKRCYDSAIFQFFFNYLSMFDNFKILLKKKNMYYDGKDLELITYFRLICMILITFINNFEVLIKIPSKDFFYESFYQKYITFILKFSSFSVDVWLCLDGFESMYKLIGFYKKYVYSKHEGTTMPFKKVAQFYFYSSYKIVSFFIFFFIVNYFDKYFIHFFSEGPLFEYYSNHIYNNKLDNSELFRFFIPGYSFYYIYHNKCSIFQNLIIAKFSLLFINEFYAYTIFILIFYISNLIKSQIFDYSILIVNFFLYFFNYLIVEFKEDDKTFYSYKLVFDNFITIRYPHIVFNYFFLGAMTGLTCFYYKDSFSSDSMSNDNDKCPFRFCYDSIKLFDFLIQHGRKFWIVFCFIIQIFISFSFYILIKLNDNSISIPFDSLQKFVLCYESGLFIFMFNIIAILITFIKSENEVKEKNNSSLIYLIERTNFSFFHTINLLMYTLYCFFNFQLKLTLENLFIVTFGLFFIVCLVNVILTLAFVFLFKMLNKNCIKFFLKDNDEIRVSQAGEIIRDTTRETVISRINTDEI